MEPSSTSLKGRLLISDGRLYDPNFRHTVVLMGQHDAMGAVGVVLNRPLAMPVREAVPPLVDLVEPGAPLFEGGPVAPEEPVLLVETVRPDLLDVPIFGSVGFLTGDIPAGLRSEILRARVFAGHAGWGAHQLESELEAGTWILEEPRPDDVFSDAPERLWATLLQRKGPEYARMARIPFDPSMN